MKVKLFTALSLVSSVLMACENFSGNWLGTCLFRNVDGTSASTTYKFTILQQGCDSFTREEQIPSKSKVKYQFGETTEVEFIDKDSDMSFITEGAVKVDWAHDKKSLAWVSEYDYDILFGEKRVRAGSFSEDFVFRLDDENTLLINGKQHNSQILGKERPDQEVRCVLLSQ